MTLSFKQSKIFKKMSNYGKESFIKGIQLKARELYLKDRH